MLKKLFIVTSPRGDRVRITARPFPSGLWRMDAHMTDGEFYTQIGKNVDVSASGYVPLENVGPITLVKDYSENRGFLQVLVGADIVRPTGRRVETGYVVLHECYVNPEVIAHS